MFTRHSTRIIYASSQNVSPLSASAVGQSLTASSPLMLQQKRNVNLFAEFAKSVKRQIDENKDFKQNIKQLEQSQQELQDSDAVKRAKEAMEKGKQTSGKVYKGVKTAANAVGDVVDKTMDTPLGRATKQTVDKVGEVVSDTAHKVADPIMETKAAKTVASGVKAVKSDIVDTNTTHRYIEYRPKEEREAKRLEKAAKDPFKQLVAENPEAGSNVTVHQETRMNQKWAEFKDNNPVFKGLLRARNAVEESDNPVLERFRDWFGGVGEESEEAQVIRLFRHVEPSFTLDGFLRDATEFYIPDVMEAYLLGDTTVLKEWCSEQLLAQLTAGINAQKAQGLISASQLLDIRKVELVQTKILDNDVPVLLIDFNTQEVLIFKNAKGEVVLGSEDNIEHARYRMVFTKDQCVDPSTPINPKTYGWKALEAVKIDSWSGF